MRSCISAALFPQGFFNRGSAREQDGATPRLTSSEGAGGADPPWDRLARETAFLDKRNRKESANDRRLHRRKRLTPFL
jgi:hypothetical protein